MILINFTMACILFQSHCYLLHTQAELQQVPNVHLISLQFLISAHSIHKFKKFYLSCSSPKMCSCMKRYCYYSYILGKNITWLKRYFQKSILALFTVWFHISNDYSQNPCSIDHRCHFQLLWFSKLHKSKKLYSVHLPSICCKIWELIILSLVNWHLYLEKTKLTSICLRSYYTLYNNRENELKIIKCCRNHLTVVDIAKDFIKNFWRKWKIFKAF